jgi:hypothetical protein
MLGEAGFDLEYKRFCFWTEQAFPSLRNNSVWRKCDRPPESVSPDLARRLQLTGLALSLH